MVPAVVAKNKVVAQSSDGKVQVLAPANMIIIGAKVDILKLDCPACLHDITDYVYHETSGNTVLVKKLFGCPNSKCENHGLDFNRPPEVIILTALRGE